MKILLSIGMFLIPPLLVGMMHMYWMRHRDASKYKKFAIFLMYLILINICTFSISYARGVKSFNFEHMTLSYRLKYMGLGCMLGLTLSSAINIGYGRVKQSNTHLFNKERYSNFDLLKIISMGMIVLFHYAYGKWDYSSMGCGKIVMDVIWMFGELGVNLFALISGYFMIEQERPFRAKRYF